MALLDLARRFGYKLIVCHVNYQKRKSAWRDEAIVRAYCDRYGLPLYVAYAGELKGNFQASARLFRYEFFLKIAELTKAYDILMAHQKDDFLETLLMQVDRKEYTTYYGIRKKSFYKHLRVYRPLLDLDKKALETYCKKQHIAYGIDETNLSDHYTRNYMRHHPLSKLSPSSKEKLYRQVLAIDEKLIQKEEAYLKKYSLKNTYNMDEIKQIGDLRLFLDIKLNKHMSYDEYREIKRQLFTSSTMQYGHRDRLLFKEGDIVDFLIKDEYEIKVESRRAIANDYVKTSLYKQKDYSEIHLEDSDFPLVIRNFKKGDKIRLKEGNKKVSRIFIDRKVRKSQRLLAPVVLNRRGEIIMVPPYNVKAGYLEKKPNYFIKNLLMER